MERSSRARARLLDGLVIPAHPLALTAARRLDERRQRALTRYYLAAGAGGLAIGVHTTQFAIRAPSHGLYAPVLSLAAETARADSPGSEAVLVAGLAGDTRQAVTEAETARALGYDAGLLSLGAWRDAADADVLQHCRTVSETLPLFGFYLQPAVGGRPLGYEFWRGFAEIERVWAIKIAPFDRYATLDVVRAVADAGRDDIALYTGNDDAIVSDLVTPLATASADGSASVRRIVGGLLGQWAVWTRRAVELLARIRDARERTDIPVSLLRTGSALTEANAAIFDAQHRFAGCIPGIHEILRRQELLAGTWTLDPAETLSPGQAEAIDRVCRAFPDLADDAFVAAGIDDWMR